MVDGGTGRPAESERGSVETSVILLTMKNLSLKSNDDDVIDGYDIQ